MKVGFLITARLKSTRLPKKLLLNIFDIEIIRWMIRRVKLNNNIEEIVICTSTNKEDDPLIRISHEENIKSFRGSEDDVIARLNDATQYFGFNFIINITADCPLVSYSYIDKVIEEYKQSKADFIRTLNLPHGLFIYGLSAKALQKVVKIKKELNTEVWGKLFTETGIFKVKDLNIPKELIRPKYRLTLDYPEDFQFFKKFYTDNGPETYKMSDEKIISYLDNNPEVVKINAHCEEMYKKRWDNQANIKL